MPPKEDTRVDLELVRLLHALVDELHQPIALFRREALDGRCDVGRLGRVENEDKGLKGRLLRIIRAGKGTSVKGILRRG